jgi:hypothetical protein
LSKWKFAIGKLKIYKSPGKGKGKVVPML